MSVASGKDQRQEAWFGIEAEPASRPSGTAEGLYAGVVFNRPLDQVFTYRVPPHLRGAIRLGQRLRVPLGRGDKATVGYCVQLGTTAPQAIDGVRLKNVMAVLDDPPLIDASMLELTQWL